MTEPSGDLDIRLLGPVEVLHGERALDIGGKRQRRLLALLAIEPARTIPTDRLIDELWAGDPPPGAATTLKVHVSRLRASLRPALAARLRGTASGYRLDIAPDTVDIGRFEQLGAEARRQLDRNPQRASIAARDALALWRGNPFGDVGDEGVLAGHAIRLREIQLETIEVRLEAELALGQAAELVGELEALVAEHPYRERFWRQLMLALYRAGRQADALAAYHRARRALVEELGIEPGGELADLEAAILRHDVGHVDPVTKVRDNLPAPMTSFIGRRTELADVNRLATSSRLLTLTGVGGVGKTRLGLEAARAAVERFPDGAWFVDLARLSAPELLPNELAAVLDVPEDLGSVPMDRLIAYLREREALIVLDNCEHLVDACATLAQRLLERCPGLRILATSRLPLGVAGEIAYPVPPLSLQSVAGDTGAPPDAIALFVDRASAASPGLAFGEHATEVVERICRELEGLPLAIELAAARARSLALPDIADRLGDRFRFLVSWRRLRTARHRTLREAMDWSYELLAPEERRLLERLSVFAGGFDFEAAVAVSGTGEDAATLDLLERLIDASLVTPVVTSTGSKRYYLLETVREYATERRLTSGDDEAVRLHGQHYAEMAVAGAAAVSGGGIPERDATERLAVNRDNLRAALEWFRGTGDQIGLLRMAEAMWSYWWKRGDVTEGRTWLEAAVDQPERAADREPGLLGRALLGLSGLCWSQGDFDAALPFAAQAEALFERAHDDLERGRAWNTIGVIEHGRGRFGAARAAYERSIELMRSSEADPIVRARLLAKPLDNLGSTLLETGDVEGALGLYEEARRQPLVIGRGEEGALFDLHVACAEIRRGRHEEAAALLGPALEHFTQISFLQYTTECLEGIGYVANARRRHLDAATLLGASSVLRERTRTPYWGHTREEFEREATAAREALGDEPYLTAWDAGRADPEAAIRLARQLVQPTATR